MPKEVSHWICQSVGLIHSVFKMGKNYYPWVFLEEYNYIVKEQYMPKYITNNVEIYSVDSDEEDSHQESNFKGAI